MELKNYLNLVRLKIGFVALLTVGFLVLGMILTLAQPLKYSSGLRLLVVQDSATANGDPYAMARANEYLSEVLSKVTYSTSFYNLVLASGLGVDSNYFGTTPKKTAKLWSKTIEVKKLNNTGIISVTAYHPNRDQAERIARGVGQTLMTQHMNYHGAGDKVMIKLLDEPLTSKYPVKPNPIINGILSLAVGLFVALAVLYLKPEWALSANPDKYEVSGLTQSNFYKDDMVMNEPVDYHLAYEEPKETLPSIQPWHKDF